MVLVDRALDVVGKVGPSIFPLSRVIKLVRCGSKITNSSNPITIVGNITLTVIDCCSAPPVRLIATCLAFGTSFASTAITPDPVSLDMTVHFASEIYDNCI